MYALREPEMQSYSRETARPRTRSRPRIRKSALVLRSQAASAGEVAYPRCSGGSSGQRFYSSELGRWASRDPIGEEAAPNAYVLVDNSPITESDFLGLLAAAKFVSKFPSADFDFNYKYRFYSSVKKEDVVQVVKVKMDFTCDKGKTCSFSAQIPERFRLKKDPAGGYKWTATDGHYITAEPFFQKYCRCTCFPCCDLGTFEVSIEFHLFHGKGITAPGSGNYSVLDSVTLASGSILRREQSVKDCEGTTKDVSANFNSDWSMTPIGGTASISKEKIGALNLAHTYSGKLVSCFAIAQDPKPAEEDYK